MTIPRHVTLAAMIWLVAVAARADPSAWIGRLNHAGFSSRTHCTATLIAGGHIVTASHCLPDTATETVTVVLGYDRGRYTERIDAPGGAFRSLPTRDIAILCRATPRTDGMQLATIPPQNGQNAWMTGYGRPRVHMQHDLACGTAPSVAGTFVMDCQAGPGFSGSPVLAARTGQDPTMIGVVSAAGDGISVAFDLTLALVRTICAQP